jgi:hypothetical protein
MRGFAKLRSESREVMRRDRSSPIVSRLSILHIPNVELHDASRFEANCNAIGDENAGRAPALLKRREQLMQHPYNSPDPVEKTFATDVAEIVYPRYGTPLAPPLRHSSAIFRLRKASSSGRCDAVRQNENRLPSDDRVAYFEARSCCLHRL